MKKTFLRILAALALTTACATPFAVFDPVNDDSDLFRNNPNIPAERPNVLIILDNTANWSSGDKFSSEKSALVSTVAALDSSFNVGLMIFTQGGQCQTSNIDGAYVRFAIRQMTDANKTALTAVVNGFADASCNNVDTGGDQGSAAVGGQAMHEAYLYYAGLTSRSGKTQERRDYTGNTHNTQVASLGNNAHSSAAATVYNSPITDLCAKSYIIFISNGPFSNGDDSPSSALYAGTGGLVPGATPITLNPSGSQSSWVDEYAYYLANTGVSRTIGGVTTNPKIFTYAVEVDAGTTGQGPSHSALMASMATQGKGIYKSVTSANSGVEIVAALLAIFSEIQAVNSVFAASTLPVSVNVRGTNLNQLYIGVFRPDATDRPRWLGNLKAYQLKRDSTTNTVFTVDANGTAAINNSTGFITSSAKSFWTSGTVPNATYWSFRSSDVNGIGGVADSPDGDLVEKGGAAQQIRGQYFANGPNGTPFRPLYTCTTGTFATCKMSYSVSPSLLSATPFSTANTDIDSTALALSTRTVSPLTALVTKNVTSLVDKRSVSLNNAGAGGITGTLTVANNAAVGVTLSNAPSPAVAISSMSNGAQVRTATCKPHATVDDSPYITFSSAHGLPSTGFMTVVGSSSGTKYSQTLVAYNLIDSLNVGYTSKGINAVSNMGGTASESCTVTTSNTTTVVTTATPHNFGAVGTTQTATILGASPSQFAISGGTITITGTNTFSFTTTVSAGPTLTSATVSSATTTVKATGSFSATTFQAGQQVTISAPTTPSYSGTYTILSSPAPTLTTFYYSTPTAISTAASGSITAQQTGSTATLTFSLPIGASLTHNQLVTMSGATPNGYNGNYTITCPTGNCTLQTSLTYPVAIGTGPVTVNAVTAATGFQTQVTATLANHGFSALDFVTIAGAADVNHNGSFQVLASPAPTSSVFYYSNAAGNTVAPGGSPTARLTTNPKAYATIAGHGLGSAGATLTNLSIVGAAPAGYTVTNDSTGVVVDADTIRYTLASAPGTQTGTTVSATLYGTTAYATSAAHGYITGQTVTISGASPSAFNGVKDTATSTGITVTGVDTFTYPLATPQGAATGTVSVVSSGSTASERDNVINWIRGEDNYEDENANSSFTDTRASIHGDVLHSRPAVVNYNRRQSDTANIDNDVYIYYGGNDGIFRSVKGGFGSSTTSTYTNSTHMPVNDPLPGEEVWGFVAKDHFGNLRRLRINSPGISSTYKKPYFFDGPIGTYTLDANGDGMLDPNYKITGGVVTASTTGDKVWIFLGMRRGGRFIYALDVTDPKTPKMMWRKGCPSFETDTTLIDATTGCDMGWGELGQTWSEPKIVSSNASTDPVLFFGAGYDSLVEDLDPSTVTNVGTSTVTASSTTYNRSQGRGIYAVNAKTGAIIWQARGGARADSSTHAYLNVTNMNFSIPSDIAVVVGDPVPKPIRAYVGDTGGNMWRMDIGDANPANWTVAQLASIGLQTSSSGRRKFQFAPDVIGTSSGYDMVIAGSGDREHPFDTTVQNRVYAFKDKRQTSAAFVSGTQQQATITETATMTFNGGSIKALRDVSTQCIEIPANCTNVAPEAAYSGINASQNTSNALVDTNNTGWFITLASGEKQVGGTLAAGSGIVQFATNQPSASAGGGSCSPNLGVARQYAVNYLDGTAYNGTTLATTYAGGGFLPSPVLVFVGLGGASGTGTTTTGGVAVGGAISGGTIGIGAGASTGGSGNVASAVVCYGASCSIAPGTVLFSRVRKFWYKEID